MNFISFPDLGILLHVDPIAFTVGPFTVRWYGIVLSIAIFTALALSLRHAPKYGVEPDRMVDMFMFALPISIVFARVFFVIVEWDTFRNDLPGMFKIWEGGITIYGAVVGAVLTLIVYCAVKKYSFWQWIDFACVYLPFAQAIGRWGNFFNQELYGTNTTLPWGMTGSLIQAWPNPGVDGSLPVHPTFLYESLWNLLVFAILLAFRPKSQKKGQVFGAYLFLYSIGRFGMEFIRTDVFSVGDSQFRANMIAAAAIAVLGVLLFVIRGFSPAKPWVALAVPGVPETSSAAGADRTPGASEEAKASHADGMDTDSPEVGKSAYGDVLKALKTDSETKTSNESTEASIDNREASDEQGDVSDEPLDVSDEPIDVSDEPNDVPDEQGKVPNGKGEA